MSDLVEKELSSIMTAVTVFSRGAEIERSVALDLKQGDYRLVVKDLPQDADPHSIRVEGLCDGQMEIGIVDSAVEAVVRSDDKLTKPERKELEKQLESLEDSHRQLQARIETLETQKKLVNNLAQLPLQPDTGKGQGAGQDWRQLYDLIGERLGNANDIIFKAQLEERDILEKISDLRRQLKQKPPKQHYITAVSIRLFVKQDVKGQLKIRYHINNASWKPVYDIRLETGQSKGAGKKVDEASLLLERRAEVRQHSNECWDDVALKLSTTSPSSRTSAPRLSSHQLDEVHEWSVEHERAMSRAKSANAPRGLEMAKIAVSTAELLEQRDYMEAEEQESETEQSAFQTIFSVPDKASIGNRNESVRVYLLSEKIEPDLFIKSVPKLDVQAFLYAGFKWQEKIALLAGKTWLYRDGVFVGNGTLPLINQGETHQIGFGSDDKVRVSRHEMNRITGNRGLIKNHKVDERHFIISVENLHDYLVDVRIVDQVPFADNEKIVVELLPDSTPPSQKDVGQQRGLLLWKQELSEKERYEIVLHYNVSWPKEMIIRS